MKCRGTGGDCEREAVCKAEGLCNYTGSPLPYTYRCFVQDGCDNRSKCNNDGECQYASRMILTANAAPGSLNWCDARDDEISRIDPRTQPANPKQAFGDKKVPLHLFPYTAIAGGCLAFLEGNLKYGRDNFRVAPVEAMTYVRACDGHMKAWAEGREIDPDSGLPELWKALACIAILIDAKEANTLIDNRKYPGGYNEMQSACEAHVKRLNELHSDKNPKHYTITDKIEAL